MRRVSAGSLGLQTIDDKLKQRRTTVGSASGAPSQSLGSRRQGWTQVLVLDSCLFSFFFPL